MDTYFAYSNYQWSKTFYDSFPIKMKSLNNDEGYYHYTSLQNALNILSLQKEESELLENQNDYISLFASHFLYLNDGEELLNGLELIKNEMKKKIDIDDQSSSIPSKAKRRLSYHIDSFENILPNKIFKAPNHFIICFCRDGNLLSQWQYYGKECGIAIEFDLKNSCYYGLTPISENKPNKPISITPKHILYSKNSKQNVIKAWTKTEITDETTADIFALHGAAIASFMKHPSFDVEKEVRLLFSPIAFWGTDDQNDVKELIKFRESNGIVKPYMEIKIKHREPQKHPIKSITVGPGRNQEIVFNAIIKFVETHYASEQTQKIKIKNCPSKHIEFVKIGEIEVRRSTIPFRG